MIPPQPITFAQTDINRSIWGELDNQACYLTYCSKLVSSEFGITFVPLLQRKLFGLETVNFHSPQKHFFYPASLGCVLENWGFAKLIELMDINYYLSPSRIFHAIIT